MTSTASPHPSAAWAVPLKAALSVVLVLAGTAGAAFTGFLAFLVGSDCVFSCKEGSGNPLAGTLLGAVALGLLCAGPVLSVQLWRRARTARAVLVWAAVVGAGLLVLLLWFAPLLPLP